MAGQTIESNGFASLFAGVKYDEIEIPVSEYWLKAAARRLFGMKPKTAKLKDIHPIRFQNFFEIEPQTEFQYSEPMNPEKW